MSIVTTAIPPLPPAFPVRRRRWLTWLLATVVFISGLVIGGAGATLLIVHQVRYAVHHPDEIPARATARLTRRLGLNAEQSADVERLLRDRMTHIEQIRRQFQPEFRGEINGFHADVRKVLDPKQQAEWDKLFNDLVTNWLPTPMDVNARPTTMP